MVSQLKDAFDRSFKIGQSQCVLLLGGRTKDVPRIIGEVSQQYSARVLELSGLLCSDDLQALQCLAMQISHMSEVPYIDCNFQSTLRYIREALDPQYKIVLSIYDIQEFAHKNLKQVLLYTLFELVHEERCMICVIGITNRLDFIDMLEKRIKSRFSYQTILMLDNELLENLIEGLEIEDFSTRAIQQLKQFHLVVLVSYIRVALKKVDLSLVAAFKEYEIFKSKSPMIVYKIDKFTFSILTNYLIKSGLLKINKKHVITRFTSYTLTFDPNSILYSIKKGSIEVPTAIEEWVLDN